MGRREDLPQKGLCGNGLYGLRRRERLLRRGDLVGLGSGRVCVCEKSHLEGEDRNLCM